MSIEFGMATKYSDDLSANVRRGNREALERGRWPGCPRLGYIRDRTTMQLVQDPDRFSLIGEMWRLLIAGTAPLDILARAREEWGLCTPARGKWGGQPISKSALYRLFRDDFYAGWMTRSGVRYRGTQPPMITQAEFDAAQAMLDRSLRPAARPKDLFFPYRGLITCGTCGSLVTAKNLTKSSGKIYTYYHCFRKERRYHFCPEPSIQEVEIERQVRAFLAGLVPPPAWQVAITGLMTRLLKSGETTTVVAGKRLSVLLGDCERRLERLRRLCVDGVITPEEYQLDRAAAETEQLRLEEELARVSDPSIYLKPLLAAPSWLNLALDCFDRGTAVERRELVRAATCYLKLTGKKLLIEAKRPFSLFGEWSTFPTMSE